MKLAVSSLDDLSLCRVSLSVTLGGKFVKMLQNQISI